jgi:hypothetical protein
MPAHPPAIPLADRLTLTIQEAAQTTAPRITLLREVKQFPPARRQAASGRFIRNSFTPEGKRR